MNSLFEWNPGQHCGWWLSKLSASVQLTHLGWSWHWCSLLQSHRDCLQLPTSPVLVKCRQHSQWSGLGLAHKLFFSCHSSIGLSVPWLLALSDTTNNQSLHNTTEWPQRHLIRGMRRHDQNYQLTYLPSTHLPTYLSASIILITEFVVQLLESYMQPGQTNESPNDLASLSNVKFGTWCPVTCWERMQWSIW